MFSSSGIIKRASRSRFAELAVLTALPLLAAANAQAACDEGPGTPTDVSTTMVSSSSIRLNWRDTTKPGEIPLGPFYDIEVTDENGQPMPQSVIGEGNLFGGKMFEHLEFNKTYCFRIKARTEQGTEGCVSLRWSERACERTPLPPLLPGVRSVEASGPWAAVAASGDGIWGFQIDGATQDQARRDARAGCGSAADRCITIRSGKAKCLAYATSERKGFHFGIGIGDTGSSVISAAINECSVTAPSDSCRLIDAACRTP